VENEIKTQNVLDEIKKTMLRPYAWNQVSRSLNTLYLYVYKCSCKHCYVTVILNEM